MGEGGKARRSEGKGREGPAHRREAQLRAGDRVNIPWPAAPSCGVPFLRVPTPENRTHTRSSVVHQRTWASKALRSVQSSYSTQPSDHTSLLLL